MATPCWPAPVSAMTRRLPICRVREGLPQRVVDFVGAGMVQVFAFQIDSGPAALPAEAFRRIERRRPAHVVLVEPLELRVEGRVGDRLLVLGRQLDKGLGKGLGNVAASKEAKSSGRIGNVTGGGHAFCIARMDNSLEGHQH